MQNRPKVFFLLAFCLFGKKCVLFSWNVLGALTVQQTSHLCKPPSLPSGLTCPCWGAEMEGHPSDRQGTPFFSFFSPSTANALNHSPKLRWCQMTSTGGNAFETYKRCDFLHLSCRLPFTGECAEGLTMPQKWLKLLAKGRSSSLVLQGSGSKLCTRLPCISQFKCSQISSLSKSRSHQQI